MLTEYAEQDPGQVPLRLRLELRVADAEVIAALQEVESGPERERYALAALRIGVLSLRTAGGAVDAAQIREAGQQLLGDLRELLSQRAGEITNQVRTTVAHYFDPVDGAVSARLDGLLKNDGDLDRLLREHLEADDSTIARSFAVHLGKDSSFMKLLSPAEAGGVVMQLRQLIETALAEQRRLVLSEFSLDNKSSALSRLTCEMRNTTNAMTSDWRTQATGLVREFSLDDPNSALSRLVGRVEATQQQIAAQFSLDNHTSAISRLSHLLHGTTIAIDKNLTLDDDGSPLSRLRKELLQTIEGMAAGNRQFQTEVAATLAGLHARKDEAARSTRHGLTFEHSLGEVLANESHRQADIHTPTGSSVGKIKNCKAGDHVVQLGPESAAPGARFVWEAKEEKGYTLEQALAELEVARKNRSAQVGVFVFSKNTAPAGLQSFARYGRDVVIAWDAEDATSDVFVRAAYSVARALVVRERVESTRTSASAQNVEQATRAVERQLQHLEQIKTWSETIRGHGDKIAERVGKMRVELMREIESLDRELEAMRTAEGAIGEA